MGYEAGEVTEEVADHNVGCEVSEVTGPGVVPERAKQAKGGIPRVTHPSLSPSPPIELPQETRQLLVHVRVISLLLCIGA